MKTYNPLPANVEESGTVTTASVVQNKTAQHKQQANEDDEALLDERTPDKDAPLVLNIDDAIEQLGMGKFQIRILFAAGLCFASDAMEVLLLSFLSIVLQKEWNLDSDDTALITSTCFAGSLCGTLVLGPLADIWGRRPVFFMSGTMIAFFGIALGVWVTNYYMLLGVIFMVGFGIGGLTVPFDTFAEFLPNHARGKYLLAIQYFWTAGAMFVVVLAYLTLPERDDESVEEMDNNWRYFVVLSAQPCLLSIILAYFYVPESPRWLCSQGRTKEALAILQQAAKVNGHAMTLVDDDTQESYILFPNHLQITAEEEKHSSVCDLFAPKWRNITLRLWGNWAFFAFGYYGTILAVTKVFANEDQLGDNMYVPSSNITDMLLLDDTDNTTLALNETMVSSEQDNDFMMNDDDDEVKFDYGAIFVSSAAELLGTSLAILAVDRVGRISSQVVSYSLAGITVFLLCSLAGSATAPHGLVVTLGFFARVFEMSGTCMSWVSAAEILTTEVRSTGHSAANAMARLGAFFAPFLVQGNAPFYEIGIFMLVIHFFTVICVWGLPETKSKGVPSDADGIVMMNRNTSDTTMASQQDE